MGSWGYNSYDNDHCHDNLLDETNKNPTQNDADNDIAKVFSKEFYDKNQYKEDFTNKECQLGVVLWYLNKGLTIQKKYISRAIDNAKSFLNDKEYFALWNDSLKRKLYLEKELKLLEDL